MATPPDRVALVVPLSGPLPLASDTVMHRAVVARLEVSVLVHFIDHRLGRKRLTGGRRCRRLSVDHELIGRRRADGDVA